MLAGPPRPRPDAQSEYQAALAAFGVTDPDAEAFVGRLAEQSGVVDLWPEHEPALRLFDAMQTQWRVAMGGPIGLDYGPLPWVCRCVGITSDQEPDVFADLRVMEDEALAWFAEQADQAKSQ